jgi:hypothetical protein
MLADEVRKLTRINVRTDVVLNDKLWIILVSVTSDEVFYRGVIEEEAMEMPSQRYLLGLPNDSRSKQS